MFSAFKKFGKLGALASSVARAWSPLSLWPDGIATPGMWISPRDLTSQWQDYTGTTPVSVPGTVADSSNPVGLALDIRAGAPEVLGPELVVNGDFSNDGANWVVGYGVPDIAQFINNRVEMVALGDFLVYQTLSELSGSKTYEVSWDQYSPGGGRFLMALGDNNGAWLLTYGSGHFTFRVRPAGTGQGLYVAQGGTSIGDWCDNISVKEVPGNHMLQSTSAARPLASAYDGQTLGPGDTYDSAGYPVFQLYDGVDDGMATAAFPAGTLINGMDCMIAVRRDSGSTVIFFSDASDEYFGYCATGSGAVNTYAAGSPTVWVDGVQLSGGTSVTAGAIDAALTVGDWHILEFRGLDLSTWASFCFSKYFAGTYLPGARGDILLYPSTASTEDKDAARQWLADYYGVTLA